MDEQWYFKFDPTTGELIPGATHEKVDNSTTQDPSGVQFPVFDTTTNTWKNDETKLAEFKQQQEQAAAQVDPKTQQMAQIFQQVVALQAEVNVLKLQKTATVATSQTDSQATSQSASQSTSTAVSGGATNA